MERLRQFLVPLPLSDPGGRWDPLQGLVSQKQQAPQDPKQGSEELLLKVPQFTPQKNGLQEGPAPQGLGPVLRVDKLSFRVRRKATPFISLLPLLLRA